MERAIQRKLEEEDDDEDKIRIDSGENIDLGMLDIFDLSAPSNSNSIMNNSASDNSDFLLDDIVEL